MESKTSIPSNWNEIPKFKSDTSKWVQLKEVLEADDRRQLHFQLIQDGLASGTVTDKTYNHEHSGIPFSLHSWSSASTAIA